MSGTSSAAADGGGAAARVGASDLAALAAEVLARGGVFQFQASGCSMHPVIQSGESVALAGCRFQALRPGQIVMARKSSGSVVVHRIVSYSILDDKPAVVTMGDNLRTTDEPLTAEEVLGVIVGISIGGRQASFSGLSCRILGRLVAAGGRRRASLEGKSGWRKWQRRSWTAIRMLLRRLLRLYLYAATTRGAAERPTG